MNLSSIPSDRSQRWLLLDDFIERWFQTRSLPRGIDPTEFDAAETRLGVALPVALREFYQRYGEMGAER